MLVETALAGPGGFAAGAVFAYLAPELIRRRAVWFRRSVAVAAAVAAGFVGAEPTGLAVVDVGYSAALAGVVTLLAARAKPRTVTVAAGLAAAASVTSGVGGVLALAAFGLALATTLTARSAPVATVMVGAVVSNAILRIHLPGPMGTESAIAAVVVATIGVSGYARLKRTTRHRARRSAAIVGLVGVGMALLGVTAVAAARPGLERGAAEATRGLAAAKAADQTAATSSLDRSEESFAAAATTLRRFWVKPATLVPVVSQHLRAASEAANSGRKLSAAGSQVARATDLGGVRITDGRIPLEPIRALARPLASAGREVSAAVVDLRRVRSPWLVGPLAIRLETNLQRLAATEESLQTSAQLVEVLPDLLGAKGERRWFLAVQTPSEARATGGFIGNYGEVTATNGDLALPRFGRISELNQGGDNKTKRLIGPDDYVARYERFDVAHTWQNVTLSPDFPSVAKVIGGLYPQSGGAPVQGAIAIDPAGIAAFLRLTGPLTVPQWPEPLTGDNAERILLYEQYVKFGDGAERVDFLGEAARLLWQRITLGQLPEPQEILRVLGPAVRAKHLIISSLDEREDAALARAGINGRMAPVDGDALAVVTQNASANKIEWFLQREVDYRPTVDPATGALTAHVKVTLRNTAPPSGLPNYLIGNALQPPLPVGTNRLYFSIYTPHSLVGATVGGIPASLESELELGRRVYSTFVDLPPQSEVVVELDLAGRVPVTERYALDVHAQPVVTPDELAIVADTGPSSFRRRLSMPTDVRLEG